MDEQRFRWSVVPSVARADQHMHAYSHRRIIGVRPDAERSMLS
ncbi:MAG TPA: hypothetical protein VNW94_29460 [Streptosporangiaceae bacterium]|nr:hypothetical protein [Streptosporangiaceae bacterium]